MLYRTFLLLTTSFFVAMDGTMAQTTGWTTGDVTYNIVTETGSGPAPAPTTTYLEVTFYHEQGDAAVYEDSYFYANDPAATPSCGALISSTVPGLTNIADGSTVPISSPAPPAPSPELSCGVNGGGACTRKTTYRYKMQDFNAIPSPAPVGTPEIKTITGTKTTVRFCVRNSLKQNSAPNYVLGFRTARVTVEWTTNPDFADVIVTDEDGPTDGGINAGQITAKAQACNSNSPNTIPNSYEQGQKIQICIWAQVETNSLPNEDLDASVVIVEVNQFRFFIDGDGDLSFDNGEVTQAGVTNSVAVGTTALIPNDVNGVGICNVAFSPSSGTTYIPPSPTQPGSNKKGCVLETFLNEAFFKETTVNVRYTGTVVIQFSNGNRRSLALKNGDTFAKTFDSVVVTTVTRDTEDDSCECGGFFFLICMIMCFISSLFG